MKSDKSDREPGDAAKPVDWLAFVKSHVAQQGDELDLTDLRKGDRIRVQTRNSEYFLTIECPKSRTAWLESARKDRPTGLVRIMGCTFGMSRTIKFDALFCGGSLEFTYDEGRMTHTTTAIRVIARVRVDDDARK